MSLYVTVLVKNLTAALGVSVWDQTLDFLNICHCINLRYICCLRASVAQLIERWICDWKVAGLNSGLEDPCGTIAIFPYSLFLLLYLSFGRDRQPRHRVNRLTVPAP